MRLAALVVLVAGCGRVGFDDATALAMVSGHATIPWPM